MGSMEISDFSAYPGSQCLVSQRPRGSTSKGAPFREVAALAIACLAQTRGCSLGIQKPKACSVAHYHWILGGLDGKESCEFL